MKNFQPEKAEHYLQQAARLREMAAAESAGDLKDKLLELASQYDRLARTRAQINSWV